MPRERCRRLQIRAARRDTCHQADQAQQNSASKKIARNVFDAAISSGALPGGSTNIADHLRGNGASVTVRCSKLTPANRPAKHGGVENVAQRGSVGSQNVGATPNIRIVRNTTNVEEVVIRNKIRPLETFKDMLKTSGLTVTSDPNLPHPLTVQIVMQHYGGLSSEAEVEFNW